MPRHGLDDRYRLRQRRGGPHVRRGAGVVRAEGPRPRLPPDPGDPRRGPADDLPLQPGLAAGGDLAHPGGEPVPLRYPPQLQRVVRAEDTAALYIWLDGALRPPAAPPLDPAPDPHHLRLLRR